MISLATLLLCFVLGIVLRSAKRFPPDAHKTLNAFIINIALPALILRHLHAMHFSTSLMLPASMPWIMFGCGVLFFLAISRVAGWSRQTTGGLILSGGLANTSFVGLPMIDAFYGPDFLGIGVLIDQLGSYMVLSTCGVIAATIFANAGRLTPTELVRKIAMFTPFQAMALAILLSPFAFPEIVTGVLDKVGGTLTPLALVSVGYQLRVSELGESWRELATGLGFKLVLGPAIMTLLLVFGLHEVGKVAQVTIFESAMGPMIGGAIVAMEHGLNARLVGLMVGIGIPLGLVTAVAWSYLLGAM